MLTSRARGAAAAPLDLTDTRRALGLLADSSAGIQLRSLPSGRTAVFAASDLDGMEAWIQTESDAHGIYYGLNPVPPNLGRPARVGDVLRRRWLLIDIDPIKPDAFTDSPSTDAEHDAARHKATTVERLLSDCGWPAPLVIDSGNGWHLLYRIDLPNDDASRELCKAVLAEMATFFGPTEGKIDTGVYDAPRISKLPGTWARKGSATPDRPHRVARLVFAPDSPTVVTVEQMSALLPKELKSTSGAPSPTATPMLSARARGTDGTRGERYAASALERECGRVAMAGQGDRNNTLNRAAFAMGQLVAAKVISRETVEASLVTAATRAGLPERECRVTVRSGIEAGLKEPRQLPESPNGSPTSSPPADKSLHEQKRPSRHTLTELLSLELPEPRWAVPGLLSEGLSILAGKPKLGKSWLALNLAITIAGGGTALGMARVVAGDVLYLALEDRLRRVKDRSLKLLRGLDCPATSRLSIATAWPRLDDGGADYVEEWAASVDRPALVVIDVWAKFRPVYRSQGNQYDQDYQHGAGIKDVADKFGFSVLALHHTKKAAADDIVDDISGTLGIAGAADGLLIMTRARGENDGTIFCTGRDIDEKEIAVGFDPETFAWRAQGGAEQHRRSQIRTDIVSALGDKVMTYGEVSDLIDRERDIVRKEMWRMVQDGSLLKVGTKYKVAPQPDF